MSEDAEELFVLQSNFNNDERTQLAEIEMNTVTYGLGITNSITMERRWHFR